MKQNQALVLKWLGLSEGGYVNDPRDPGGPTNHGVTEAVWHEWLRSHGRPPSDVRNIDKATADQIFVEKYLKPVRFDELPDGLDYCMADYAVNSGHGRAVKELQSVLRDLGYAVKVDGGFGRQTMGALKQWLGSNGGTGYADRVGMVISGICNRRMAFLRSLRHWDRFGNGWTRRVMGSEEGAQDWDSGVIDRAMRMAHKLQQRTEPVPSVGKAPDMRFGPVAAILEAIRAIIAAIVAAFSKRKD